LGQGRALLRPGLPIADLDHVVRGLFLKLSLRPDRRPGFGLQRHRRDSAGLVDSKISVGGLLHSTGLL